MFEPGALESRAVEIALRIAARLSSPTTYDGYCERAAAQSAFAALVAPRPSTLSQGSSGLALLFAVAHRREPAAAWDRQAHAHLQHAAEAAARSPVSTSLFAGPAGLGFAACQLSEGGSRYRRLLEAVDSAVLPVCEAAAGALSQDLSGLSQRGPMPFVERASLGFAVGRFDVISGLAGVLLYLLCRKDHPAPRRAAELSLAALVTLAGVKDGVPLWHTPLQHLWSSEEEAPRFPHGNLNCGLAHGVPGVLAVLSLALLEGVEVASQRDAIRDLADWLFGATVRDSWGPNWPAMLSTALYVRGEGVSAAGARAAWCYGAPGVCRSLWLAGQALAARRYADAAIEGMLAVCRRPVERQGIPSPTFCHGEAGWIAILRRMAFDSGHPELAAAYRCAAERLVDRFDPGLPLGYQSIETPAVRVDNPGLLDGVAGIALVLLGLGEEDTGNWGRAFALS